MPKTNHNQHVAIAAFILDAFWWKLCFPSFSQSWDNHIQCSGPMWWYTGQRRASPPAVDFTMPLRLLLIYSAIFGQEVKPWHPLQYFTIDHLIIWMIVEWLVFQLWPKETLALHPQAEQKSSRSSSRPFGKYVSVPTGVIWSHAEIIKVPRKVREPSVKWLRDCGCEDFLPFAEFFIPTPVSEGETWTHNTAMPHAPDTCLSSKGPLVRLQGVKSDHLPLP